MNLDLKTIRPQLKKTANQVKKFIVPIFIIIIIAINGFLVFRINRLTSSEPTPAQIAEHENTIKRLKIDNDSIKKIQQLEQQNIAVKALFKEARNDPFVDQ